jgi:hypothetical protein
MKLLISLYRLALLPKAAKAGRVGRVGRVGKQLRLTVQTGSRVWYHTFSATL